jgi:hypothetical protein
MARANVDVDSLLRMGRTNRNAHTQRDHGREGNFLKSHAVSWIGFVAWMAWFANYWRVSTD